MERNELNIDTHRITTANDLYHNVIHGRIRSLKSMLDRGVDINVKNDVGENLLIAALRIENEFKRKKMFKFVLRRDADIHFKDPIHERSVLMWICVLERENELCIFLREVGGELDLKEKDKHGYTALHYATQANRPRMVLVLVQNCSRFHESVDITDSQGFTPYIMARRLGHRDIATILKEEGNASPAQSDSYRFRSCREWSSYGKWERQKEDRNRQNKQMVLDKINGDYKYGTNDSCRTMESSRENESKFSLPIVSNNMSYIKTRHDLQPYDEVDTRYNIFRRSSNAAMSILDMTSLERGTLVRSFHHSEFDNSKRSEYKDVFEDLNTILDMLSQQTSTSFRKTAIELPTPVRIIDKVPDKPKVSSLAIIMGKNRIDGKTTRAKRKSHQVKTKSSTSNKNRCNNSPNRSKINSVSPLPEIKVNNKVI